MSLTSKILSMVLGELAPSIKSKALNFVLNELNGNTFRRSMVDTLKSQSRTFNKVVKPIEQFDRTVNPELRKYTLKLQSFRNNTSKITPRWLKDNLDKNISYEAFKPFFDNLVKTDEMLLETAINMLKADRSIAGLKDTLDKIKTNNHQLLRKAEDEYTDMYADEFDWDVLGSAANEYYDDRF